VGILKIAIVCAVMFLATKQVYAQDLLETYQLALENNPTLKQAYFEKMAVSEARSQSIAKMLPSLSGVIKTTQNRIDNKKVTYQRPGVQNYYTHNFQLSLTQPVFHWEHWIELAQSENKIAQAEAKYLAEEQNLMLKVTQAYFAVLSATADLNATLAEKKAIELQHEKAHVLLKEGWIAATDVYEAEAALDKAKANQINAENAVTDAVAKLVELTGGKEDAAFSGLVKDMQATAPEPANLSRWTEAAKENNLSIIAALNQVEVNRKTVEIQRSGHYPQLDIVGNYAVQDDNSNFGYRGDAQSIGLQLTVPLFEGGAVMSRTQQAMYDFEAAKERLHKTEREVNRQLTTSYRSVLSSLAQIEAFKTAVKSATKAVKAVEAGFSVGKRTMQDVLHEQKNYYAAQRDYSHSLYDYITNSIQLKQTSSSLTQQDLVKINQLLHN
jgi:outer membrane protein